MTFIHFISNSVTNRNKHTDASKFGQINTIINYVSNI